MSRNRGTPRPVREGEGLPHGEETAVSGFKSRLVHQLAPRWSVTKAYPTLLAMAHDGPLPTEQPAEGRNVQKRHAVPDGENGRVRPGSTPGAGAWLADYRRDTMEITIDEPQGFPDTIANDLERAEFKKAAECEIIYTEDTQTVEVSAFDSVAAKQLYDWLEETAQYYKENYVDASGEYDAARQLADAVYEEMSA
jgi:hypothetical protein